MVIYLQILIMLTPFFCSVVLPLLAFDDADAELWHDDPEEYIRKGYDVIEDIYSPKTAAISLICKLCASKKKNQMDFIMALVGSILQEYTGEGSQVSMRTARRMDGALLSIGSLSTIIRVCICKRIYYSYSN